MRNIDKRKQSMVNTKEKKGKCAGAMAPNQLFSHRRNRAAAPSPSSSLRVLRSLTHSRARPAPQSLAPATPALQSLVPVTPALQSLVPATSASQSLVSATSAPPSAELFALSLAADTQDVSAMSAALSSRAPSIEQGGSAPERVTITSSLRSKIRALRAHAAWSFQRIAKEIGIATSTVFSICSAPFTPKKIKLGRPKVFTTPIHKRLIDFATASQKNRCLPLAEVAQLAGVQASEVTLRKVFAQEGYHRRIARVRPFLSQTVTKQGRFHTMMSIDS